MRNVIRRNAFVHSPFGTDYTLFFFLTDPAPPETYPLPLPDALPICTGDARAENPAAGCSPAIAGTAAIGPSIPSPHATLASTPPAGPALKRKFIPTCSATASLLT